MFYNNVRTGRKTVIEISEAAKPHIDKLPEGVQDVYAVACA